MTQFNTSSQIAVKSASLMGVLLLYLFSQRGPGVVNCQGIDLLSYASFFSLSNCLAQSFANRTWEVEAYLVMNR